MAEVDEVAIEPTEALEGMISGDCDAGVILEGPSLLPPPPHAVNRLKENVRINIAFELMGKYLVFRYF